ncbi:MAG: phosphatidate cytidylyltransferase [Phycisphaerales bacterium]
MLRYRLITGPILIIFLLAAVWLDERLGGPGLARPDALGAPLRTADGEPVASGVIPAGTILLGIGVLAMSFAATEIAAVLRALGARASVPLLIIAAWAGVVLPWAGPLMARPGAVSAAAATVPVALVACTLLAATRGRRTDGATLAAAGTVFTFAYPGLAVGMLLAIRHEHSAWWIVGIVMTTKSCDIGAYFTGTSIGRRKLIPWLSPGKTWEGLAGGVLTAAAVGAGLAALSTRLPMAGDHVPVLAGAVVGAILGGVGQLGDLAMSLLKRDAGIKDAGRVLPGMGGVMDVLDSPAMVAPLAYWLVPIAAGLGGG